MSEKVQKIDLNNIKDPSFLKQLNTKSLYALCSDIRKEIIRACSINGGHLSSNLGNVESIVALHRVFDFKKDKLLFDVGHQCYTHKILTGRSLENLRKKNGIAGFPKINESPYDCFEGGHSSNSISNAIGMAVARDVNKESYNIVVYIGDASISNGLAFEALNDTLLYSHKVIIILNENGMSISRNVGKTSTIFSKISTSGLYSTTKLIAKRIESSGKFGEIFYSFLYSFKNFIKRIILHNNIYTDMGLTYYGIVDGHNIKNLTKAYKKAIKSSKSCIIHIKTIKGYGYKKAQDDEIGNYHSVQPFDISTGKALKPSVTTLSDVFSELIDKQLEISNTVLRSPATLVGSRFENLLKKYPAKVYDMGITEEHTVSVAAGLSLNGIQPIVSIHSTFLQRGFDELSHDIAREHLNSTFLIDKAGLVGEDGDTHNGVYDEAFIINTPNTVLTMPSNNGIAEQLFHESFKNHGLFVIRYPNSPLVQVNKYKNIEFGEWPFERKVGSETVIISTGPIIEEILNNVKNVDVINAIYLKPLNTKVLDYCISNYNKIIIYDIYATRNGFCDTIADYLLEHSYKGKFVSMAIKDEFIPSQTIVEALSDQNLTIQDLVKQI